MRQAAAETSRSARRRPKLNQVKRKRPVITSHQRPVWDSLAAVAIVDASELASPAFRASPATSAPKAEAKPSPPASRTENARIQKKKR